MNHATPKPQRLRLEPADRRAQLLQVGAELFAELPYDEVSIDGIARIAGVSRGLMYRYFATKRDLFRAIMKEAVERMVDMSAPTADPPLDHQMREVLDTYIGYFEANAALVRSAYSGAGASDPEIQALIAGKARRHEDNLIGLFVRHGVTESPRLRVAVRAWILMTRMIILDWLDTREVSRADLRDLCLDTLLSALDREGPARAAPEPRPANTGRRRTRNDGTGADPARPGLVAAPTSIAPCDAIQRIKPRPAGSGRRPASGRG